MYFRTRAYLYRCLTCQQHYKGSGRVCHHCIKALPWLERACFRCAIPLTKENFKLCRQCRHEREYCLATRSLFCFRYTKPIDQMIKAWKFNGILVYESFFRDCLIARVKENVSTHEMPLGLISVPISKNRCQERGFNQSMALSKMLSKTFHIKRYDDIIGCHYQKKHQASLNANERKDHLNHAFYLKKHYPLPKHMAIIDDVMTTGATLNTIAKLLLSHGVEKIEYWGIARVHSIQNKPL